MEKSPDSNYESTIAENVKASKVGSYSYELGLPEIFNIVEQKRLAREMDKLIKEIDCSLPVLDVGSGTGNLAKFLVRRGVQVVAIDLSPAMLKQNKSNDKVLCDACYLPFKNGSFGSIISYSVLSLLPEPLQALREMCRVAARNSVLFFDGLPPYVVELKARKYPLIHASVERFAWLLWLVLHPKYMIRALK
ncbi:MAG: class I SAM-dependent methyltransferase, partial [Brevundimonas sp.]|nr:class I SAM-dependent methyltransferase [Brevundimonas sp.]